MKILITGGAGFVGFYLAKQFKRASPQNEVWIFDNLKRRGSELNIANAKKAGIHFVHGDLRVYSDFENINQNFDLFIDASAEPSVLAGLSGSARYLLDTNINGTINCLEFAKKHASIFVFLSTSRVYSLNALNSIALQSNDSRFVAANDFIINERFETSGPKSLYGTSKLSSEMLVQEYSHAYQMKTIINRCGVLVGPGQWGKTDQGVYSLWLINHYFKKSLSYHGYGGLGHQVRDLLHPNDLFQLICAQVSSFEKVKNIPYNVGGGLSNSISLLELTNLCEKLTNNSLSIGKVLETHSMDIPYYVTDNGLVNSTFGFRPTYNINMIYEELYRWIKDNEVSLREFFV